MTANWNKRELTPRPYHFDPSQHLLVFLVMAKKGAFRPNAELHSAGKTLSVTDPKQISFSTGSVLD